MSFLSITESVLKQIQNQSSFITSSFASLGFSGLEFDIVKAYTFTKSSAVTTKILETRENVSTHVASSPTMITIEGTVSSAVFNKPTFNKAKEYLQTAQFASSAVMPVSNSMLRGIKSLMSLRTNKVSMQKVEDAVSDIVNTFGSVASQIPLDNDFHYQRMVLVLKYLLAVQEAGMPILIQTKMGTFNQMVITGLNSTWSQNPFNQMFFTINLQQVYFSNVVTGQASVTGQIKGLPFLKGKNSKLAQSLEMPLESNGQVRQTETTLYSLAKGRR